MKTRTEIYLEPYSFSLNYNSNILTLGSCFSNYMAEKLDLLKYQILANPAGITFNTSSILTTIKRIICPDSLPISTNFCQNGIWANSEFHSSFCHIDEKTFSKNIEKRISEAKKSLTSVDVVILTIGTCWVYRDKKTAQIVNNCHKRPKEEFEHLLLSLPEVVSNLGDLINLIEANSTKRVNFLFSVSPVRHIKNGLVRDKRSKATALLAIHELVERNENVHYFPAYEILNDDLRDYRYYADDLIHPSTTAVDYVYQLFEESLLNKHERGLRQEILSVVNRQAHKLMFPESQAASQFKQKLESDINKLIKDHSWLSERIN